LQRKPGVFMQMKKIFGYLIAVAGLVLLAVSLFNLGIIPSAITPVSIIIGITAVVFGVILTLGKSGSKISQAEEEVPIYEGRGKERKIVAYQKSRK